MPQCLGRHNWESVGSGQNWELNTLAVIKTSLLAVRLISPISDFVSGVLSGIIAIIQKEFKIVSAQKDIYSAQRNSTS